MKTENLVTALTFVIALAIAFLFASAVNGICKMQNRPADQLQRSWTETELRAMIREELAKKK